ncbi:Hypothetical protein SRAE_1000235600 [Strongyloides ratti]|uniref:Tudor domain-containing protein n=1 Tax=Strongyloides ratti TaxID=34506 RepID=A0A090L9A2_STRRB|nr:Hypothetical protein SRAE_1000235600 [Strongyloides ratti]CEF64100.1 Hypothetical protein SRAE_1000235600 [Strongyloides ratti]
MGSFQDSNIFLHFKMVSGSKANELKEILKSNNIVQVIKDSCKKFNLVKHEGKDLIEKYKVKINENLDENINTSFIDKPKDFKNFNFGEFGKSLNASFCKNGNILGKSLKDECLRKSKSNVYNTCDTEKEIDFDSFGMVNYTRDSNDVSNYSFYNLYPCREEKGDVDVLIEELNKINKNDTFSNHFDSTIDLPPNGNTNLIKKEMINFVITNFINENEIYILCNEELELYLKNYDIIKKYDIKKLKEIKIEDVLPFNIYLIDYEGERYIVRLDINFLDIDRKIFLNNETKLSFEYNKKMKIYEYPHEILLLPNINSKKVSLSKSFCDYYQHLDIYDKKTAIDYLKSMIPPFKKFINILGMIEIGNANNKQILNMSILDGDNISEKFQRYCRELYSKEKNNFTKN